MCAVYYVRMEPTDRVVRILATDAEWKRIKMLAVERDQEIRELVTAALQTSPLTKKVFA